MVRRLILAAAALAAVGAWARPVPLRGVVEGYYGRPWGTEGRLSLLKFMGENGMNVFIYGPKDDPYHHYKWRDPYPAAEMADFAKLLACAKENGVTLYWAIHLGDGFRREREEDFRALFAKFGAMYDGGFRGFAAFFDDFGGADAAAHAEICNRIQRDFLDAKGDCAPLVMCPNVYWGTGHPYQRALGAALDGRVQVMWTGRGICADITAEDVRAITADFRRPPFIWWNWPVNDYCRSRVLLGPTCGLDACTVAGFVSNPMENGEASKVALFGIAAWCRDPEGFDAQGSWEASFAKLYADPAVAAAMRVFAEHNADPGPTVHNFRRAESAADAPLCARARDEARASGRVSAETAAALRALFAKVGAAADTLLEKLPKGRYDLGWELEGWLRVERGLMHEGLRALELAEASGRDREDAVLAELRDLRRQIADAGRAHREKFAAATFAEDSRWAACPEPSARELAPTVETLVESALRRLHARRTGRDFAASEGFAAFAAAKALPELHVRLDDNRYAGIVRLLEEKTVAPGESFGIRVPEKWQTDYFHAQLGSPEAVRAGVVELSRDGRSWTALKTRNAGGEMQARLDAKDGWRWARYRNAAAHPVPVRIGLFKFDIRGARRAADEILDALAE